MCIVIAVLNGIEISHKLFTPEMVVPSVSVHGCESVLGISAIPSTDVDYMDHRNQCLHSPCELLAPGNDETSCRQSPDTMMQYKKIG